MYLKYFLESGICPRFQRFRISYAVLFRDGPLDATTPMRCATMTTVALSVALCDDIYVLCDDSNALCDDRYAMIRWPYRSRHALIVYALYAMLHKWWDDQLSASILIILCKVTSNRSNIVASKGRHSHYLHHSCSYSCHNGSRVFIESREQDFNDSNCSAH